MALVLTTTVHGEAVMREIGRDGDEVTIAASIDELRLLVGTLNEALHGGCAFPDDIWEGLVGHPRDLARGVLGDALRILDA